MDIGREISSGGLPFLLLLLLLLPVTNLGLPVGREGEGAARKREGGGKSLVSAGRELCDRPWVQMTAYYVRHAD
jgi:hypothetical protein